MSLTNTFIEVKLDEKDSKHKSSMRVILFTRSGQIAINRSIVVNFKVNFLLNYIEKSQSSTVKIFLSHFYSVFLSVEGDPQSENVIYLASISNNKLLVPLIGTTNKHFCYSFYTNCIVSLKVLKQNYLLLSFLKTQIRN